MTDGLLTLITMRGRQPKRNPILNRSPDLGISSRTNALWRPFVRPVIPVLVTLPNRSVGTCCFQMPRVRKLRPDPHWQP